jgi:hypothetical protein
VRVPQGLDGLAISFNFILLFQLFLLHAPGARRAPPRGWWPCYFILFCTVIFVYFYNTHQVLVGLPQGDGGLAISFHFILLFQFIFITRTK